MSLAMQLFHQYLGSLKPVYPEVFQMIKKRYIECIVEFGIQNDRKEILHLLDIMLTGVVQNCFDGLEEKRSKLN
jgi:hypothetical protein